MPDPEKHDAHGTQSLGRSWYRAPTPETAGSLPSVRTLARLLGALDTDFLGLHEAMESVGKKGRDEPAPPLTPPTDSP